MINKSIVPHEALRGFVKEYLIVHFDFKNLSQNREKVFPPRPDTSIIFYPSETFKKVNPFQNKTIDIPHAVVQGQLLTNWYHHYPNDFKCVKIVFQPGGLFHLLDKMPMYNVLDLAIDAENVIGSEVNVILQQLMESEKYDEMVRVIELYLLKKYRKIKLNLEPIDKINLLSEIQHRSLDSLAHLACLSFRQFERKFRDRVGISPKLFSRIIRFNRAFEIKDKNQELNWLDIAFICGYADYQHMVKDFKQFVGVTPTVLIEESNKSPERILGLPKIYSTI
jgi:AraC-like DNA-binding protein